MELVALGQMILRRWWLVLLPVALAFILLLPSLPSILNPETGYTVAMRFTAAAPSDIALDTETSYEDTSYVPWLASEYVVVNLPQWVTSDSFAQEVSTVLAEQGLEISAEDLRPAFIADSARSILVVYINWNNAVELEAIASAAVEVLQTRNQTYFPQFAASPAEIVALDTIRVSEVPPALMTRFSPLLRLGIAFAAGLALAAAAAYLDDTIYAAEDIQALDLAVLSTIPK